jgi:polyphosphate kinase
MHSKEFFDRDLSWLSFNERILTEAGRQSVPLMERIRFLSIYSSNLDEFYRVRIPTIKKFNSPGDGSLIKTINAIVHRQQDEFGRQIRESIVPELAASGIKFLYDTSLPIELSVPLSQYFFNFVAGNIQPVKLGRKSDFFPDNNHLYMVVKLTDANGKQSTWFINIPSDTVPRFLKVNVNSQEYIVFLEDLVKLHLYYIFPGSRIEGAYNIKITRDASLKLREDDSDDPSVFLEQELLKRDRGIATRLLYDPHLPEEDVNFLMNVFDLRKESMVPGGTHHHLRDLANLPINNKALEFPEWPSVNRNHPSEIAVSLHEEVTKNDILVHTPYHSFAQILRFFNEAALDPAVQEIYVTLYRIASDSGIARALITAAKNKKKVFVLVELKARFDEANNIHWAKKMKAAGIKIIYSENNLKVHAKVVLIKRNTDFFPYIGLFSTGNFNEFTARFYTDHILMTANPAMLKDLKKFFSLLIKGKKIRDAAGFKPVHLLIAGFNLLHKFLNLIDREINAARLGLKASITIKLNNLEEETLIRKLYEASSAGVQVKLLVRSICRLVPGVQVQSENIEVFRIVDRYLEHGRIFMFHNSGNPLVYLGSADWMNRNIYHRLEVCFPIYDRNLLKELEDIIQIQLNDNTQRVCLDSGLNNVPVPVNGVPVRSQYEIYRYLSRNDNP